VSPFVDVDGSEGTVPPAQITSEVPKLNVGTVLGVTVTLNVTEFEHWPELAVNAYILEV
jgi:hypothetical protein